MVLLSCSYLFYWCWFQMKKKKKKKKIKIRKLKPKINNNHFLLRFNNTVFDVIFAQVIFSILSASSNNFENNGKYYLHIRSTEGQWLTVSCVKSLLSEFSFYLSYTQKNFRHVFFFGPPGILCTSQHSPKALVYLKLRKRKIHNWLEQTLENAHLFPNLCKLEN